MSDSEFNPFNLKNKRYLITGAASGIGRETSIVLSRLGADLILIDKDAEGLNDTFNSCRASDTKAVFDLGLVADIKNMMVRLCGSSGKINGFVHSAGIPYISPLKSINTEKYKEVISVNTFAALEMTKAFIDKNVFSGESGSVVYISSVYGLVGTAANVGYAMSKAALHGITKSLAVELSPKKIRVNCIAPGFIISKMKDDTDHLFLDNHFDILKSLHPLGLGNPSDIAFAVAFLLSDAARWITGAILNVDGGFTAQ